MNHNLDELQKIVDYRWKNLDLLRQALCHKSYTKEHPNQPHNEKLEFLGDAVLSLAVSDLLMDSFKNDKEGNLSRKRASIVNEERLCALANKKSLGSFLFVGKGEMKNQLNKNPRILASAFEALVGALYKDSGFDKTSHWISEVFRPVIEQAFDEYDFEGDYKTRLQEWAQEKFKLTPSYRVVSKEGPDHATTFEVEISMGDEPWVRAKGPSKKSASHKAAKKALEKKT